MYSLSEELSNRNLLSWLNIDFCYILLTSFIFVNHLVAYNQIFTILNSYLFTFKLIKSLNL